MTMTPEQRAQSRAICDAATQGAWVYGHNDITGKRKYYVVSESLLPSDIIVGLDGGL